MLNSCEGKSVIVTGASKGIGKGIAAVFARHGARVLVVARNLDQAEACAAELRAGGRQVSAFIGDVTNRSEMEEMARVAVAASARWLSVHTCRPCSVIASSSQREV